MLQLGVEFVDLSALIIPAELAQVLSKNLARKHGVVPVRLNKNTLYLAMSDPLNFMAVEEVKVATRKHVVPVISTEESISRAIATLYGSEGAARAIEDMKREMTDSGPAASESFIARNIGGDDATSAPTVRLVNSIIERAVVERASDIHLEPYEEDMRVRMRIDGVLRKIMVVPKNLQASVVSRLKVMGSMEISERKVPQDGRSAVRVHQSEVDLRMSTLPTIYGEKFVIRLLDKNSQLLDKGKIGLTGEDLEKYAALLSQASGVILIA
ncbi:MAG: ATPase, T2SS/T4P/T4SS family, partial [Ruthenibacterium sp.]